MFPSCSRLVPVLFPSCSQVCGHLGPKTWMHRLSHHWGSVPPGGKLLQRVCNYSLDMIWTYLKWFKHVVHTGSYLVASFHFYFLISVQFFSFFNLQYLQSESVGILVSFWFHSLYCCFKRPACPTTSSYTALKNRLRFTWDILGPSSMAFAESVELCWTCCRLSWMSLNISTTSPCCWPAESWVECLGQSEAKPGVNTITNSEPKLAVSPRHLWRWVHLFSSPPLSWAPSCMAQPKLGSIRKQPEKICYTNSKIWTVADTSFMHLYNFCILLQHTKPRILTN